jgi:hypothetical protein
MARIYLKALILRVLTMKDIILVATFSAITVSLLPASAENLPAYFPESIGEMQPVKASIPTFGSTDNLLIDSRQSAVKHLERWTPLFGPVF